MEIISAAQAAEMISDNSTVAVGGFCGFGAPDTVLKAIQSRYQKEGMPKDITLITPAASGTGTDEIWGVDALGEEGLVSTVITSILKLPKRLLLQANDNKIAAFCPPLGYFGHMYRALGGKEPGVLTHSGLYTYCDPRLSGCAMNEKARNSQLKMVELMEVKGKEYLFYPVIPIDFALIRGSYADRNGNISVDREALLTEITELATAVHNNGGIVIAQVEKIVDEIHPRHVAVHKQCIDYVVITAPGEHLQNYTVKQYRPELVGDVKIADLSFKNMEFGIRKVIARRAAMELIKGGLINLGLGISEGISMVASEEGVLDDFTFSIETGVLGGLVLSGGEVGAGINSEAFYRMSDTFDLYHGGGLDECFLSAAQIDKEGNVNVSMFNGRVNGPGGFVDISQNAKEVSFSGIFTAGKTDEEIIDGKLVIHSDGNVLKYVDHVEQITFSGKEAIANGQKVRYISERCVMLLTENGLMITEIAPGVDMQKDILNKMEFTPLIADDLKEMDRRLFYPEKMNLKLREKS